MGLRHYAVPLVSWGLLAVVATVSFLSTIYVIVVPAADQNVLANRDWAQFAAQDPEAASIISRYLTLLGLISGAFSLLAIVVSVVPYRRGDRWAWYTLWLVPMTFAGAALPELTDQYATRNVGYFYAGLAALAVVALLIPIRHFLGRARD